MPVDLVVLTTFLEKRDLKRFFAAFEESITRLRGSIEFTALTQTVLPPILHTWLAGSHVPSETLLHLWKLVSNGTLVVADNDLRASINSRIDLAWREVNGDVTPCPEKLHIFRNTGSAVRKSKTSRPLISKNIDEIAMQRIIIHSTYTIGHVRLTQAGIAKRNLCNSSQEREFLKAVRQFMPTSWAYPNIPLENFIDIELIGSELSKRELSYFSRAKVDVLLCTHDEDPIAGIELDSTLHDVPAVVERDTAKNRIFSLAGIPLVRIRANDTRNVRAEDFFDLLMAQRETLEQLRPERFRPRRSHDTLVPL